MILVFILAYLVLFFAIDQNYFNVNNLQVNKIGYVETTTDIHRLLKDFEDYKSQNNAKILITASSYWPLPVYLNKYTTWYLGGVSHLNTSDYAEYDIFIANDSQLSADFPNFEKKIYELRKWYYLTVLFKKNL